MSDFNIRREDAVVSRISGNRTDVTFYPPVGRNIAVAYIQPDAGNDAAVNSLLGQIKALCSGSGEFGKKVWITEALDGKRPAVDIRVVVRDNAEVE